MMPLTPQMTTKDAELDTCTKCGKKTGQASFVLGHTGQAQVPVPIHKGHEEGCRGNEAAIPKEGRTR